MLRFFNRVLRNRFTFDDIVVPFIEGETILEACIKAGIPINKKCDNLNCRHCEIAAINANSNKRVLACTHQPTDGTSFRSLDIDRRKEAKNQRKSVMMSMTDMRERARLYEERTGVSLKDDSDEEDEIDWNVSFAGSDTNEVARRCFNKLRDIDPHHLSQRRLLFMLRKLPGFEEDDIFKKNQEANLKAISERWCEKHSAEMQKVTFDNVASYEP